MGLACNHRLASFFPLSLLFNPVSGRMSTFSLPKQTSKFWSYPQRRRAGIFTTLPTEIFLKRPGYHSKSHWTTFRLVCYKYHELSAKLLSFATLVFSPHAEDLKVFNAVYTHPHLGLHVNTIIYDMYTFGYLDKEDINKPKPAAKIKVLLCAKNGNQSCEQDRKDSLISRAKCVFGALSITTEFITLISSYQLVYFYSQLICFLLGSPVSKPRLQINHYFNGQWVVHSPTFRNHFKSYSQTSLCFFGLVLLILSLCH